MRDITAHSSTLVALETWTFASPELKAAGIDIDLGLLAEALIYYETVFVNVATQPQLRALVTWFVSQGAFEDLVSLLGDGTLRLVDFSFMTAAVRSGADYTILNIQDAIQAQPNSYEQRFLYHREVAAALPKSRHRERLIKACRGKVIELKAAQFERGVKNAHRDAIDPARASLVIQSLVDEAYRIAGRSPVPEVVANITESADGAKHSITWNVNPEEVSRLIGPKLNFHLGQPLVASATANRLIWAAASLGSDLYLGRPMSRLVGEKLNESAETTDATRELISDLQVQVEFPDVRQAVNSGKMPVREILHVRKKAERFRRWLQTEAERDRDAIIAYHLDVAKESGLLRASRRSLSIFGALGASAAGGALGTVVDSPAAGALVGLGASGAGFLLDVAAKLGTDWRPVVFGEWLRDRTRAK